MPDEELLVALISISTGIEDVTALGAPEEIGRKLLACHDELA